jgi:putative redox protein
MGELASAVESYRQWLDEDEQRGEVTLRVSCDWLGGTEVAMEVGRHTVRADEPKSLGGGGTAPTPVGYLMAALGSCVVIGLSYWSDILDIPFDSADVVVEGDIHPGGAYALRDGVSPSFSDVRMEIRVSGSESEDRYEALVAKMASHSPLLETFNRPIAVSTKLTVS